MISEKNAPRFLGAAFLLVIVTSLLGGLITNSAIGTGSISDILAHIAKNLSRMKAGILFDMLNSLGVIILAALLYTVLKKQNKIVALIALGWWLGEGIFYAISGLGAFALIPLSRSFIQAGASAHSFHQALGEFLYYGIYKQGITIHMFFYCFGGILWYGMFYRSRYIPRVISLFGVLAASVGAIGIMAEFFGYAVPMAVYIPLLPFELIVGFWLLLKGINERIS